MCRNRKKKGKVLTMNDMLGVALCDASGPLKDLIEKMSGKDGAKCLEKLNKMLRGEPVNAEEMIYIPLEWSRDLGEAPSKDFVDGVIANKNRLLGGKCRWRLPTDKEISRALRAMKPSGFVFWRYYWTSTPSYDGHGLTVVHAHGSGGLGSGSNEYVSKSALRLRLCREMEIPEQE